jgi:hypothetical protein
MSRLLFIDQLTRLKEYTDYVIRGGSEAEAEGSYVYSEQVPADTGLWDKLTSRNAILTYLIILLAAILLIMILMIVRTGRDIKAREAEKKNKLKKKRFSRLAAMDEAAEGWKKEKAKEKRAASSPDALEQFCDDFRNFAAGTMGLYYDHRTIRAFVSSLSVTKLIILQGISGTGKTSLPYAFGKFVANDAVIVPVQPSWRDKTDMLGYYNEFTDSFTETELLCKLYEANLRGGVYMTVLDEMNIARVEYYFAEFLSLLELPDPASRKIEVVSSRRDNDPALLTDGKLLIPENIWFAGTANNDDSTMAISDKVYDRAMVLELSDRARPFTAPAVAPEPVSALRLEEMFRAARSAYSLSDSARLKIARLDEFLTSRMRVTFGNRVMKQTEQFVPVYIAAGGTENEAIDLILCKKVLRKLENQNPVYVSAGARELIETMDGLFGEDALPLCKAYVSGYVRN